MDPIIFLLIVGFSWITLNAIARTHWFEVKNPEVGLGYAMYRTTKLNTLIDRLARRGRVIWKFIWDIGVISGLGILIVGLSIFTINIPLFFQPTADGTTTAIGVTPVIPGITVSFQTLPYFIVAIMIGAIAHEFAHGIAARVEDVDLKSTGIFIFLVLFGAFVEPDDEILAQKSRRSKVRIMAAGALANMVVAGIVILILIIPIGFPLLITPLYHSEPNGALIIETIPEEPASLADMKAGYAIIGINSSTGYAKILSASDFREYVNSSVLPNQTLIFHFASGRDPITLETVEREDDETKGYIGIRTWEYFEPRYFYPSPLVNLFPYWTLNTLLYIFMINLMLAIMNLLPIPFLDGDKLLTAFLGPKFDKYLPWIRYFTLGVLGINLLLTLIVMGWPQL
ncbi:MAG: site-2 protease family protein [Candidatus Heimdallarchaeota archaeon]|nr:MAG: site-2 protease family protein [Candidatus Heimdallarchaeota archaeon]